ncbi:Ig heavy chain Mem5-like [Scyliorhinus canicula]|uniref:Ig heavy chain Mem5-like n=1 Tax=Scyliorhinus canicula TaxID=7830 RepID=UPI0018F5F0EB|nr:Ig heavy chain Mem5-like [Scyliorhinus canicula]
MESVLSLSVFLCVLSCVKAEVVLTQPEGEKGVAGQSLTLSCRTSGFDLGSYYMYWYRQIPGKGPEWLARYYSESNNNFNPELGGRVTASKDLSNNIFSLSIGKLAIADRATYYCAQRHSGMYHTQPYTNGSCYGIKPCVGYGTADKLIFGNGTRVIVEPYKVDTKGPKLSIFYPPAPNNKDNTAAVCLASDFYPKDINLLMWSGTDVEKNVTRSTTLSNNGDYKNSGFLTFAQTGESVNVACKAIHEKNIYSENLTWVTVVPDKPVCPSLDDYQEGSMDMETDRSRVNFLSLTVMGLRVLFFKSIAFNVMMTARVWLC